MQRRWYIYCGEGGAAHAGRRAVAGGSEKWVATNEPQPHRAGQTKRPSKREDGAITNNTRVNRDIAELEKLTRWRRELKEERSTPWG